MALFAMAVPIAPGKFVEQLGGPRHTAYQASRARLGVRERAFFQQTPHGDLAVVTLEGENPQAAFARFGEGTDDFTEWFVAQVKAMHDFDLRHPPPGPLPELVVDSQA